MSPIGTRPILATLLVALLVLSASYVYSRPGSVLGPLPTTFRVAGMTYHFTYTAADESQREAGLMNKKITDSTFMLFAWPAPGLYQFYMYNTNSSLDIIWIDATGGTGTVVYVYRGAQPCFEILTCPRFTPTSQANYVIEAKAGFAEANGITEGTQVQFQ